MDLALTFRLAARNLMRNTRRTILTVMLIGFSLAALIATDAVIYGMIKVMEESVTHTLAGEAQVYHKGFNESYDADLMIEDSSSFEKQLADSPAVAGYSPRVIAGGMISSSYNVAGGLLYGVDAAHEASVSRVKAAVKQGHYLTGAPGEMLIGRSLADLLEVQLGDRIVVTVSQVRGGDLAQALFRVSGILDFGIRELDDGVVFVNLPKARETLGMKDESHQIAIRFTDPDDANRRDLPLYTALSRGDVVAVSWLDANPEISSILEMSAYSSLIVGTILFLLASLGVINSMFMSIYERIYEIGVIKAIGTRPGGVVTLVLAEALLIALLGALFGLAVGGLITGYYSGHGIPMGEMEMSGVSLNNTINAVPLLHQFTEFPLYVIVLTVVAAIYPARFAARIAPAMALQRSL